MVLPWSDTAPSMPTGAAEPVSCRPVAGVPAGLVRGASPGDGSVPQPAGGPGLPAGGPRPLDAPPSPGPAGQRGEGRQGSAGAAPDWPTPWVWGKGLQPVCGGREWGCSAGSPPGGPYRSV